MIVTICGGGHLGHVCAGFFASQEGIKVRILTRRPQLWNNTVEVTDPEGKVFSGKLDCVTDDPSEALMDAEIVLICLPGFSIAEELEKIMPHLSPKTAVGSIVSSTGFFFMAFELLPKTQPLFGFQRVPFISRTKEYGHSADLLGYKPSLSVAIEQCEYKEVLRAKLETLFKCPVTLLESHYEVSLTNSNPLLHTSRLFTMWKDYSKGKVYDKNPHFYSDWTDEASVLLIAMDGEFQELLRVLGVREGAIPTILDYYESHDAVSLTHKLNSIKAFKGLLSPMREVRGGYVPDSGSRYFTEDFPYSLKIIYDIAHEKGVKCPIIDMVFEWGMKIIL
jgi:hypothetical protein